MDAVLAGDVAAAKRAYAPARIPYERIEPVAKSFGDLDPAIDALAGDVPAAEWGGFHRIEQALWVRNKVSKSKITGEEERYSRTDLVDFKANLDGSRAAFDAVRAPLDKRDAPLATEIQRRFDAADRALATYRSATGYLSYNWLTDADTRKLSQAIDALAEPSRRSAPGSLEAEAAAPGRAPRSTHAVTEEHGPAPPKGAEHGGSGARLSRRRLLTSIGAGGAALGLGGGAYALGYQVGTPPPPKPALAMQAITFYGDRQAGIITPQQDRLHFAAFDVTTTKALDLVDMLRVWTRAAARMCNGDPAVPGEPDPLAPPADSGEVVGLAPARLTLTFGFGPSLFGRPGSGDRFGIAKLRPPELDDLPPLPGDQLEPGRSGGDIGVQACADDPQVAFHAIRSLARIGRGVVALRWSQAGFGRTSSTSNAQETPRNLQGFKDGTNNIRAEDTDLLDEHVWVPRDTAQEWIRGGTYMVVRRIRMLIEVWDRATLEDQEATIGRERASGAPLGGRDEFEVLNFTARRADGRPAIPVNSHVRLAAPESNGGAMLLRRGYSFTDTLDRLGQLDAGLFFICFQQDPRRQFVPIQRSLGARDALNDYISHTGSALFACPGGIKPGSYVGEPLLG